MTLPEALAPYVRDYAGPGRHDPVLYRTCSDFGPRRCRAWCCCSCGWASRSYTTVSGAHLEFGEHLLAVRNRPTSAQSDGRPAEDRDILDTATGGQRGEVDNE